MNNGDSNIIIGSGGATNLINGTENILIGNGGNTGDNNAIRIGTIGNQTDNYQAGIYGNTGGLPSLPVYVDVNGKLSTIPSSKRLKIIFLT